MKKKLFANWGIKLISLLAAFSLWFVMVFFENPPEEETFVNIPVQFLNTDKLTDQNLVYEVLEGTDTVKRVTVKGPKTVLSEMRTAGSDCIIATADFEEKNMLDVIDIQFSVISEYENAITDIQPAEGSAQVKLFVEEKESRSVPIRTNISGEVAEDHQLGTYKTEQTRLTVTGGKSKVDQVSYAAVTVDVTGNETDISTIETIRLYDKEGKILNNSLVQKNISTTKVNVSILDTKVVPIEFEVTGQVREGYRMSGVIDSNRDSIKLAGTEAALAAVNSIVIPQGTLDVTGLSQPLEKEINLRTYLPYGVQIARDEEEAALTVTVYIEPIQQLSFKVFSNNLSILNVPEGMTAQIEQQYSVYDVTVSGLQDELESIEEPSLKGFVDVEAWMLEQNMEQLSAGSYYIPAQIILPEGVDQQAVEVRVTFTE